MIPLSGSPRLSGIRRCERPRLRRRASAGAVTVCVGLALIASGCGNGVERTAKPDQGQRSSVLSPETSSSSAPSGSATPAAQPSRSVGHRTTSGHTPKPDDGQVSAPPAATSEPRGSPSSATPDGRTQSSDPAAGPATDSRRHGIDHAKRTPSSARSAAATHARQGTPSAQETRSAPTVTNTATRQPTAGSPSPAPGAPQPTSERGKKQHQKKSGPPICSTSDLQVGVKQPEGGAAAGSAYVLLTFQNTSSATCKLVGHAGVSFVGKGNGTKLGDSATWSGKSKTVRLTPGDTAPELLQIGQAGNYDPKKCVPTTADGFRVYPPRSYSSVLVKYQVQACQRKGPHQLTAFPIGTGG